MVRQSASNWSIAMQELWFNPDAAFTKWVVAERLLREPFAVVDVGVQGGADTRWNLLGDYLILHGFDAIAEVIANLKKRDVGWGTRRFYNYAIGETDGERSFYFDAANPTASSMYAQGAAQFGGKLAEQTRTVMVRRLDSLFADGTIPRADFLKVDVEGFEKKVFLGARGFISAGVLGIDTESNFRVSPEYPKSHFTAISDILVEHGFTVFDLVFNRIPRASFTRALERGGIGDHANYDLGRPATLNLLFCRDPIEERDAPQDNLLLSPALTADQIIKMMIIYELHGLNDIALDTAHRFTDSLAPRLDVERAFELLAKADCCRPGSDLSRLQGMAQQLHAMRRSTSWRITAPLRATKSFLSGRSG
jgi:FkbM family methyltransferase